ncbi:MAG: DHH family phosphoesterase [Candidatus Bathyarchaeota archaeon]|nr:DHH family phosphoesterase [Candidatus Bathyarchaeota archaeon]
MSSEEAFLSSLDPAIEALMRHVEDGSIVRIVTHSDADGIAAGGILSRAMGRLGVGFKTTCEKRVDKGVMEAVAAERPPLILFSDIGSGYLDMIAEHLSGSDVIILDHHLPVEAEAPDIVHVNPLLHGLDGARGVSGAGVAYLFSRLIDDRNVDLSPLGIVGALADQQDKGEKRTLLGLNRRIEEEAKEAGLLETKVDLIFYGYETRPIARAIAYTTTPFIPGLSGREDQCLAFLRDDGIELKRDGRWRALRDLSEEEKRTLFSALSKHLIYEGCDADAVYGLIGTIYTLTAEEAWTPMRDGREYASLLNACARMERPSLGLATCLGDRDTAMKEAEGALGEYRRRIAEYLDWVREGGRIEEMANIYVLPAEGNIDDRIIGVVASILLSTGILKKPKPIIAWARAEEGLIKVSARGTGEIAQRGVDLGSVMMEAAERFRGRGGGHDIAAGAFLSEEGGKGFLNLVDELVGEQRKA